MNFSPLFYLSSQPLRFPHDACSWGVSPGHYCILPPQCSPLSLLATSLVGWGAWGRAMHHSLKAFPALLPDPLTCGSIPPGKLLPHLTLSWLLLPEGLLLGYSFFSHSSLLLPTTAPNSGIYSFIQQTHIHSAHHSQLNVKVAVFTLHPAGCNLSAFVPLPDTHGDPMPCGPSIPGIMHSSVPSLIYLSGLLQVSGNNGT